jgi:hypothetical protein
VNVQARAGAAHGGNDVSLAAELKTRSRHEITFFNLSFFLRHRCLRPFFRRPFFRRDTINQLVAVDTYVGLPYERSDGDQSLASRPKLCLRSTEIRTMSDPSNQHSKILEHHRPVSLDNTNASFVPSFFDVEAQVRSRPLPYAAAVEHSFVNVT